MSNLQNAIQAIFAKPENSNGETRSNSWVTKGKNSPCPWSGELQGDLKYNGVTIPDLAVLPALLSEKVLSGKITEEDFEALLFGPFCTGNQVNAAKNVSSAPISFTNKVESSEQFRLRTVFVNCSVRDNTVELAEVLFNYLGMSEKDKTKANLEHLLSHLLNVFYPASAEEDYQRIKTSEEAEAAKYMSFVELGFTNISKTKDGDTLVMSLPIDRIQSLKDLEEKTKYKLTGKPVLDGDMLSCVMLPIETKE